MKDYIIQCGVEELIKWSSRLEIGIYYKTLEWVHFVYTELVKYFTDLDCLVRAHVDRYGNGIIQLKNGTAYHFVKGNETSRGHKFHKVYMQDGIDDDIINVIIEPSIIPYKDLYMVTR
jgi:hypothetical protein